MAFVEAVKRAIREADESGLACRLDGVSGLSGDKLIGTLQRITKLLEDTAVPSAYLEIGVYQGNTLVHVAAAAQRVQCFGIDNFSQFDRDGKNEGIVRARLAMHTTGNARLINEDFESALLSLGERLSGTPVGVYFVDGPHDYRSQYLCLDFARQHLSENAVVIVDDSNYEHVRRANRDWLHANPEFALVFQAYTPCHPDNMSPSQREDAKRGWWDGVNVIVRDPKRCLRREFPPVGTARDLYFNDHLVHPHGAAASVPLLLDFVREPPMRSMLRFAKWRLRQSGASGSLFPDRNTYSANLTSGAFVD